MKDQSVPIADENLGAVAEARASDLYSVNRCTV
jgi:hypothetical protein